MTALSEHGCSLRRGRFWAKDAVASGCDFAIVANPIDLVRLANFAPSPFVFNAVGAGGLLLLEADRSTLITDNIAKPFLDQAYVHAKKSVEWYSGKRSAGARVKAWVEGLLPLLPLPAAAGARVRIGLDLDHTPTSLIVALRERFALFEPIDIGPALVDSRRRKDEDELGLLKRSIAAGEAGHAAALAGIKPGMTEFEAFLLVERAAREALGEQAVVYGDFASGPRTEHGGGPPTDRVIAGGDRFLLDFSVVVQGYRGDFANSFVVAAEPSASERTFFDLCMKALAAGEARLGPGIAAREIDRTVRGVFHQLDLDQYFPGHSGHGLGLAHPEAPFIVPESDDVLEVGDVVTLEPGLYIKGTVGMRYERNYCITNQGYELLSHHRLCIDQGS